jgi:hypothetical protein
MNIRPNFYAIIPANIRYAKDIPPSAKLLYAELTALAGLSGICSAPNSYFAEAFNLTEVQVSNLLNLLNERKYIKITLKQNYLRTIQIMLPRIKYPKVAKKTTPQTQWNLKEAIDKLKNSTRRDLQIIALWIELNNFKPENREQLQSIISRNIKTAQKLKGYTNEDITETFNSLCHTDYIKKITLETITKYIDFVVANRKKKGPKIVKWVEYTNEKGIRVAKPIYEKQP